MLERVWTFSNLLSLSRVLLVLPLASVLLGNVPEKRTLVAVIIAIGAATDFLDGYLARRRHEVSELGKIIDPLADKIAVGCAAALLTWAGDLPLWYLVVVILRDVLILMGGLYIKKRKNIIAQSNWPGKVAVTLIAMVLLLSALRIQSLETFRQIVVWVSVVLMTFSLINYVQRLFIGSALGKKNTA